MKTYPKLSQSKFFICFFLICLFAFKSNAQCNFELNAPAPISCKNECTGTIEVNTLSGAAPFTHSWSNGETTSTIDSLCPGMYSVTVVDNNGCTWEDSIQIDSSTFTNNFSISGDLNTGCGISVEALTSGASPFNYSWNNGSTNNIINNLCDGQYSVVIEDTLGCEYYDTVEINNTTLLATTHPYASVPAGGPCGEHECNGQFAILINAGTPPYDIAVSNGFSHTTNNNYYVVDSLCAGQYHYTITDNNGQTVTNNVVVEQTQGVVLNWESVDTLYGIYCYAAQTGKVAVHPQVGTPPYNFSLNAAPYQSNNVFSNLSAGIHTVYVTDSTGCSDTIDFLFVDPPVPSISVTDSSTCYSECDGQLSISVVGGLPPFTYSYNNGLSFENGNTFDGLCSGSYNVVVKDGNGCLYNANTIISEYPTLNISPTVSDASCHGIADGQIDMNTTGGTPTYYYSVNEAPPSSNHPIDNLNAGFYNILTTDANGCSIEDTISIDEPPSFNFIYIANNPSTCGQNDGTFEVAATNGTAPYSYSITGPTPTQTTGYFQNLYAGIYVVNVVDANGCTDSTIVAISDDVMTGYVDTQINASCYDSCNATVHIDQNFGQSPYTYTSYNTGITNVSGYFDNLCVGTDYVTIVDNGLCKEIVQVDITEPDSITFDTQLTDISCPSFSDGVVDVSNVLGGDGGPYSYSITNDSTNFVSSNTFSGLNSGTDTLWVKDGNGCLSSTSFNINEPPAWDVKINTKDLLCNSDNSGYFNITSNGGTPPYSYSVNSNVSTSTNYSSLSAGNYNVSVIDDNSCTFDTIITIDEPAPLVAFIDSTQNPICNGNPEGKIYASATGGTFPHMFSHDSGITYQIDYGIYNLFSGTYDIIVEDKNGCTAFVSSAIITDPSAMSLDTSNLMSASCTGVCDGSAIVDITNGNSPFTILSPSDSANWINMSSYSLKYLCAGSYNLDVYDNLGCKENIDLVIDSDFDLDVDTLSTKQISCYNACNGNLEIEVLNGVSPYTITHNLGQLTNITTTEFLIDSICAGNLQLQVTDNNGCVNTMNLDYDNPAEILISSTIDNEISCYNDCDGSAIINISNGIAPYNLTSSNGNLNMVNSNEYSLTNLCEGTIDITVTDDSACTQQNSFNITQPDSLYFTYDQIDSASCTTCSDGGAEITVYGGTAPFTVDWSDFSSSQNGTQATDLMGGTGEVCVTDANGCQFCDSVTVDYVDDVGISKSNLSCKVIPNPANDLIQIQSSSVLDVIIIRDIQGKIVKKISPKNKLVKVNVDNFEAGVYLVTVQSSEQLTQMKLVVE